MWAGEAFDPELIEATARNLARGYAELVLGAVCVAELRDYFTSGYQIGSEPRSRVPIRQIGVGCRSS